MSILDPPPVVHARCARCGREHEQRWTVSPERPAEAWSECAGCGWITIWTGGRVERPEPAAGEPMPPGAADAIIVAATGEQDEARRRIDRLRSELAAAEAELVRLSAFADAFADYQRRITECGNIADKL